MSGGDTGYGLVYELASKDQGWVFNTLYNFTGGSDGSVARHAHRRAGRSALRHGKRRIQNCGDYCGLIYSLRPAPTACLTSSCSWTESVVYQPTGNNDVLALAVWFSTQAGNLYGTSGSGGAYGQGAVFELTPSNGGWTETILYSFTGGSDGGGPGSLAGRRRRQSLWNGRRRQPTIWRGFPVSASALRWRLDGKCDLHFTGQGELFTPDIPMPEPYSGRLGQPLRDFRYGYSGIDQDRGLRALTLRQKLGIQRA